MGRTKQGKVFKTISFDPEVLRALQGYCERMGTQVSSVVNHEIRKIVLNEVAWHRAQARYYCSKMNEHDRLAKEIEERKTIQQELQVSNGNH